VSTKALRKVLFIAKKDCDFSKEEYFKVFQLANKLLDVAFENNTICKEFCSKLLNCL
jgi:hypothetical protein